MAHLPWKSIWIWPPEPMQRLKEKINSTSLASGLHLWTGTHAHTHISYTFGTKGTYIHTHNYCASLRKKDCVCTCHSLWGQDNLWELGFFSFLHVGPGNQTQVLRFSGKCSSFPMSHLTGPKWKRKRKLELEFNYMWMFILTFPSHLTKLELLLEFLKYSPWYLCLP